MHNPFLNDINRPTRNPSKRNRRGGACVPARTFAQRRFHTKHTHIVCGEFNDGCAPTGRHGRAHRHRPYQNTIIFFHAIPYKPNNHLHATHPNETVGAVPVCPPERPRSGVSIQKKYTHCARDFNDGCALVGRHGRAHRHRPYQSPLYIHV